MGKEVLLFVCWFVFCLFGLEICYSLYEGDKQNDEMSAMKISKEFYDVYKAI